LKFIWSLEFGIWLFGFNLMRIISGASKGRKLAAPRGYALRPTSDRIKESIFNILGNEVEGKVVLDLFAGTGNLGIEALSRGAKQIVFVERAKEALRMIERNLFQCGFSGRAEVIPKEVNRAIGILEAKGMSFDLILMDPPYEKEWVQRTLLKLNRHKIYHEGSILVIEHSRREPLPQQTGIWTVIKQRRIGDTMISILTGRSQPSGG
jgi:16S rRNA (guanine(966)-N(2))-methyltransferase RsmD